MNRMTSVAIEPIASARRRPIRSLSRPPAMAPTIAQMLAPISSAKPSCVGTPSWRVIPKVLLADSRGIPESGRS